MTDKLKEALRRAEEAVLKDGKLRDEEAKKDKEVKPRQPVELDDEHFKEKKSSKPIDLDDVLFSESRNKKPAAKPVDLPKQKSEPPMVDLNKKEKPQAAPKKAPASRPPPKLSFGELDLSGASADSQELELAAAPEEPDVKPAAPAAKPPEAKPAKREPPPRRESAEEHVTYVPRRSYGRQIKIFLIVVLILAAVGGGVWGFLKWRASVEAAEAAEKAKIESSSRDSLMDDKFKKEKFK